MCEMREAAVSDFRTHQTVYRSFGLVFKNLRHSTDTVEIRWNIKNKTRKSLTIFFKDSKSKDKNKRFI